MSKSIKVPSALVSTISPTWEFWGPFNQTGQTPDETRENTHRSLTTGQLFLLTEPATGGCCTCHFSGVGHQLRRGQLRSFLCISNKKPERHLSPNPAESFTSLWTYFFSKTIFWCQKTWTQLILSSTWYLD